MNSIDYYEASRGALLVDETGVVINAILVGLIADVNVPEGMSLLTDYPEWVGIGWMKNGEDWIAPAPTHALASIGPGEPFPPPAPDA